MDKESMELLENLLNMNKEQRAFIAERLIRSLDSEVDESVEAAWQKEIQRRVSEADNGQAVFISWEDAKKRLKAG